MMKKNIGNFIEIEGFISTTLNERLCHFFSVNAEILIEVPTCNLRGMFDNGFAHLSIFSDHPNEREVLINAFNLFKIISCRRK
jgi:hypothetical protein